MICNSQKIQYHYNLITRILNKEMYNRSTELTKIEIKKLNIIFAKLQFNLCKC